MTPRLIILATLLCAHFLLLSPISISLLGQVRATGPNMLEVMDPETMYSFSGLEGKGFLNRKPVNLPQPAYDGEETGIVGLEFTIQPDGKVSEVRKETFALTTANEAMVEAAKAAVIQWKFSPIPATASQKENRVRVIIQFNNKGSGVMYSVDGLCKIEGLGGRAPIELIAPGYEEGEEEGVVTAIANISPEGKVNFISKFYGAYSHQQVRPRLGIITYTAIRQWRFDALPQTLPQEDIDVTIQIRYQRLE
ncbi:MAG: energy transducer TonB [Bacteroidia bacterium]